MNYAKVFEALLTAQRSSGVTLSGGKVYFYVPGTNTLKTIYSTRNKTVAANPYTLSANGTATLYGDGLYDVQLKTAAGVDAAPLWEDVLIMDSLNDYYVYDFSSEFVSLADAATNAAFEDKTIVITSPQVVTTAIAWPDDRELKFEKGGYVTFTGSGALTGLPEARPEWFGTGTEAVGKAIATGGVVKLRDGVTYTSASITYNGDIKIEGSGTLKHADSQTTPLISSTGAYNHKITGITIDGNQANQSTSTITGRVIAPLLDTAPTILITGCSSAAFNDITVVNGSCTSEVDTYGRGAITFVECSNAVVTNANITESKYTGLMFKKLNGTVTNTYGNRVVGGSYNRNGGSGIVTFLSNDVEISGATANENGPITLSSGISINGYSNKVIGCTALSNGSAGINVGHAIIPDENASNSIVSDNIVAFNNYGISIVGDNTVIQNALLIIGNRTDSNIAAGIAITGYAKGCIISNNITRTEVIGIRLAGEQHLVIGNDCGLTNNASILVAAVSPYVGRDMIIRSNILEGATVDYLTTFESGATVTGILNDGYLVKQVAAISHTGTTAETTVLTIPLRSWLIKAGYTKFRVKASGAKTGTGNKTIKLVLDNVTTVSQTVTTTSQWGIDVDIQTKAAKTGDGNIAVWDGATKSTDSVFALSAATDFGDSFNIYFKFTLATAGEAISLTSYSVELVR